MKGQGLLKTSGGFIDIKITSDGFIAGVTGIRAESKEMAFRTREDVIFLGITLNSTINSGTMSRFRTT